MNVAYSTPIGIDDAELVSRRALYEIDEPDLVRLRGLRPLAETWRDGIADDLYSFLLQQPATRAFLTSPKLVQRLKATQAAYFMGLFDGRCDLPYVTDRLRVGAAHERIGLQPVHYIGAYRRYLALVHERLAVALQPDDAAAAYASLVKLVAFDMSLAIDTYIAANLETLGRHQRAIRALSTPVLRVHAGVLLLPLLGAVDGQRALEVMETVLECVAAERAQCLIIDVAGLPVVDTKVADSLIKATAAAGLLGARTVVSGIGAETARTMVRLGIDISSAETRATLAEGIERALAIVGQTNRRT